MFSIDDKELKQYKRNLENLSKNAFPKVVRSTLDRMAFLGLKEYKKNFRKSFVVRNAKSNIIIKSMRYEKCSNTLDISKMQSFVGQAETTFGKTTDQLRKQEFGEYLVANGKHLFKPTKFARGGNYKKAVKQENLLSQIKISKIEDLVENPAKSEFKQFRQMVGYAQHNKNKKFYTILDENYAGLRAVIEFDGNREVNETAKFIYSLKDKTQKLNKVSVLQPVNTTIGSQAASIFSSEMQRRITREMTKSLKKG